jgi:hypothetical protein
MNKYYFLTPLIIQFLWLYIFPSFSKEPLTYLIHNMLHMKEVTNMEFRFTLHTLLEVDAGSFLTMLGTADTATPPL